jgi:Flp pilus assembly protein TadD
LKPESPDVLSDLGVTYREQGQYDQALELFHKAQSLDPNHWRSLYNEVVVLAFDQRNLDDADRVLQRLQQLQPGNPDVQKLAAEVERSRNKPS